MPHLSFPGDYQSPTRATVAGVVLWLCAGLSLMAAEPEPSGSGVMRVGILKTLFRETPEKTVHSSMEPFQALIKQQTGKTGEFVTVKDVSELSRQLMKNEVQLAVFQGFEFAWARQTHAELKPLVIAVNQQRLLRACVMVRKDHPAAAFKELKGKPFAVPAHTREHCRLFLQRRCAELSQEPEQFFSRVTTPPNIEDALDDVVDGLVPAALVDEVGLDRYRQRKPGRFARLKELERSAAFPSPVVVYLPGSVDEATLQRFRSALLKAPESPEGRQMLSLWKLTGFESVPDDYEQTLADIAKVYPAPSN